MMKKVGFIGLGDMGKPMAKCLLRAGVPVASCYHIRREPLEEIVNLGATEVSSPEEVARASEVVISMVRDEAQTSEVLWGQKGVMSGAKPGTIILIMSTLSPLFCQKAASEAGKKGVGMLDAPVSGGSPAAEAGTLTIMVGGKEQLLEDCRPILEAMGKNIFYLGDIGMGQAAKLANNVIALAGICAATEGLALGVKAGVDLDRMLEIVRVSSGNSWVIEHWKLISALKKAYKPGAPLDIMYKDLELALDMARELQVDLPIAALATQLDVGRLP